MRRLLLADGLLGVLALEHACDAGSAGRLPLEQRAAVLVHLQLRDLHLRRKV